MNFNDKFTQALPHAEFLSHYANEGQKVRWHQVNELVSLTSAQHQLLGSFQRTMNVICLAGAWCGDCSGQCPIFEHFAKAAPVIQMRYLDRDDHADVQRELQVCGGNRVPVLLFLSEDGHEVARYGERTLSKYRQLIRDQVGDSCSTGIIASNDPLLAQITQDWLNEFERVQWILRLSPRLRQKHGD